MRQLRITEAFAKYGAKLRNQKWSYPAFAEDNSLVLCCWQRYLTKNPDGSYRYEVNDFTKWTANPLGKALLVDHLKRAKAGKLVVRMILVTTTPVKAVVAGVDGSKIKKTFQVLDNLAGHVVEMTEDRFVIDFQ